MWGARPLYFLCLGIIAVTITYGEECPRSEQQDIVIVLDSSTSIARKDFAKQLKFVNNLIDKIDIGPDANQVGVISFSDNYRLNFHLNTNRAITKAEKERLKSQVSAVRQIGGGTNTHKPLEYARRHMFTSQRGDRADKLNVCIVITDGQSYDPDKTAGAAKNLMDEGVQMFALGVGPKVDADELEALAGNSSRVFRATSYDELNEISEDFSTSVLGRAICNRPTTTPIPIPPPMITGYENTPVEAGTEVSLRCASETTDPDVQLYWFRNGVLVPRTTHRIEGPFVVSYFTFTSRLSDDGKDVECVLEHDSVDEDLRDSVKLNVGRRRRTFLALPGPPMITSNPSGPVSSGSRVILTCASNGTDSNTEVNWYRANSKVDGTYSTSGEFVVNEMTVTAIDSREYECRVEHPRLFDDLVDFHTLQVYSTPDPPEIKSPGVLLATDQNITLQCTAEKADSNAQLFWLKGEVIIDRTYSLDGSVVSNDHTFSSVSDIQGARCEVRHRHIPAPMIAIPQPIVSVILPGPPVINEGRPYPGVVAGTSVTLSCKSFGTERETAVTWHRSDANQRLDGAYTREGGYVVNNYTVRASDNPWSYECRVSHPQLFPDLTESAEIPIIEVPGRPEVTGVPTSIIPPEREVRLLCRSRGTSDQTRLIWYKDGERVDTTYFISGQFIINEYEFTSSEDDNDSDLECRLEFPPTNLEIPVPVDIRVQEVPGNPVISNIPDAPVRVSSKTNLLCRSRGTSEDTRLVWFKGGERVDWSYRISGGYVVNEYEYEAEPVDLAKLECRMEYPPTNLRRSDLAIINIRRPDTPNVEQVPQSVELGDTATLVCRVRHNGNLGIQLHWRHEGATVDQSHYVDGNYIINKYEIVATEVDQRYECQLTDGEREITVPHILNVHAPFPPPTISGRPFGPINPGDSVELTCKWPIRRGAASASLRWVDPASGAVTPGASRSDRSQLLSVYTVTADSRALNNIHDCEVVGVTNRDNVTLNDRVQIPVNQPTPPDCTSGGAKMDVVIILDSSTSLTRVDFKKQVDFVSRFAGSFDIGAQNVRVGVISFSTNIVLHFNMNEHNNRDDLLAAIADIKQIGGGTNTNLPIQRAREQMFTRRYGDRPDVPNLCIVITDGRSYDTEETARQAALARDAGIEMYAIGIGRGVDVSELGLISGDEERVYFAEDYNSLARIENEFVSATRVSVGPCPTGTTTPRIQPTEVSAWSPWTSCSRTCGPGTQSRVRRCILGNDGRECPRDLAEQQPCITRICPTSPDCPSLIDHADIAFLLDTSSSVYEPDFEKMKLFLADFIDLFNVSESRQRIASLTFSDDVSINFYLNDFHTNRDVKEAFLSIPMHLGGTKTDQAILAARREIFSELNGARMNSAKLAFIITDGRSYNPAQTAIEAELARQSGILVYSIGIGPEIDETELERIAGTATQVYHVTSYDDITQLKRRLGLELSRCYDPLDPVDGRYGSWSPYSDCSVTCGTGMRRRTRVCDSPVPRNGGRDCEGPSVRTKTCKKPSCGPTTNRPPQGWTDWEFSSPCSATCGEGTQEVSRYCQYEDGCRLGQVESKVIKCQITRCQLPANDEICGGDDGINVMFASQGINSNGPNSYFAVGLIANATALLSVDGNRVRTSLTLSDCTCGKNTGYDLTRYRNYEDIYNHLHDLDLGDTASLLRKVRSENNIMPSMTRARAFSDNRQQVLVYMFDSNDVITQEAVDEANKLRMAGVTVYAAVLDRDVDLRLVRQMVSRPENNYLQMVNSVDGGDSYVQELYRRVCSRGE